MDGGAFGSPGSIEPDKWYESYIYSTEVLYTKFIIIPVGVSLVDDVVFTVITQRNSFHIDRAHEKRELWSAQLRDLARVYCKAGLGSYSVKSHILCLI